MREGMDVARRRSRRKPDMTYEDEDPDLYEMLPTEARLFDPIR